MISTPSAPFEETNLTETPSKACFKCHEVKPLTEFYVHKMMADGHLNKCKECTKKDTKTRFVEKREEVREYDKLRESFPERKAKKAEYQRRRRARNPEKNKARAAVGDAVHSGRLIPMPCEACGSLSVQAHHDDYSKPLDVRWLCFKHHREVHGQNPSDTENVQSFTAQTDAA